MRFLFVRPEFCPSGDLSTPKIRLSSDSASRRTPLPLAKSSRYRATSGLSPYRTCAHRAHSSQTRPVSLGSRLKGLRLAAAHEGRTLRTFASRAVFSPTYTPPEKMIPTFFALASANSARLFRQSERRTRGAFCTFSGRLPDLSLRGSAGAVAISQDPTESWESHRRNRNCLPEIAPQGHFLALRAQGATSACGLLAMTNLGVCAADGSTQKFMSAIGAH